MYCSNVFYRHFSNVDELGLTLVDEAGLTLWRPCARLVPDLNHSVIQTSVDTFMEYISQQSTVFRHYYASAQVTQRRLLCGSREVSHFTQELTDFLIKDNLLSSEIASLQAEAMVKLVFSAGADALELTEVERQQLSKRVVTQLRFIVKGAEAFAARDQRSK